MKLNFSPTRILSLFSYGPQIRPFRDWSALISIGLILLLVSASWNAWLFFRVFNGEALAPGTPATEPGLSVEALSQADAIFERRATEEARYRNEYQFIDPSL